jgi:hypothetical protein
MAVAGIVAGVLGQQWGAVGRAALMLPISVPVLVGALRYRRLVAPTRHLGRRLWEIAESVPVGSRRMFQRQTEPETTYTVVRTSEHEAEFWYLDEEDSDAYFELPDSELGQFLSTVFVVRSDRPRVERKQDITGYAKRPDGGIDVLLDSPTDARGSRARRTGLPGLLWQLRTGLGVPAPEELREIIAVTESPGSDLGLMP